MRPDEASAAKTKGAAKNKGYEKCGRQYNYRCSRHGIERAADVCLKEGRKLILAIRDTPFSRIHLENMLRAQQAGADIFPIIPSFYHQPRTIEDLVTQFCCRLLAHLDLDQPQQFRWMGETRGSGVGSQG